MDLVLQYAERFLPEWNAKCRELQFEAAKLIIDGGSAVSFAKAMLGYDANKLDAQNKNTDIALAIANMGQLIWHCASSRAVTHATWLALPRGSAVDPPMTMSQRNKILGNERLQEHVECVFEEVLAGRGKLVRADAKIDVVGVAKGGLAAVWYLSMDWKNWRPFISVVCLTNHYISLISTSLNLTPHPGLVRELCRFLLSRLHPV